MTHIGWITQLQDIALGGRDRQHALQEVVFMRSLMPPPSVYFDHMNALPGLYMTVRWPRSTSAKYQAVSN